MVDIVSSTVQNSLWRTANKKQQQQNQILTQFQLIIGGIDPARLYFHTLILER